METNLVVHIPTSSSKRATSIDLSDHMGHGYDAIVQDAARAFQYGVQSGKLRPSTIFVRVVLVRRKLFPWLAALHVEVGRPLDLSDLDQRALERFASDMRRQNRHMETARKSFAAAVGLLRLTGQLGLSAPIEQIFPKGLFPPHQHVHAKPYSRPEQLKILRALTTHLAEIRARDFSRLSPATAMTVYFLLLSFRTGFNATAVLQLSRDALREHPVRPDFRVLVSFKWRAHRQVSSTLPWADPSQESKTVFADGISLYQEVLEFTKDLVPLAPEEYRDLAFLRPPVKGYGPTESAVTGVPVPLTEHDLSHTLKRLSRIHNLRGDDGSLLNLSNRRIRATLAQRIDELSGGDPFVKAHILGNSPKTASVSYAEPPPDGANEFSKALERLQTRLCESAPDHSTETPVGRCTDSLHGQYAPKDGVTHCERWLHCFKCPNQCITGEQDDLWRLYSFYWALQVNAQVLGRMPISGLVRFAVRVMDTVIVERYGKRAREARQRARDTPHPFWAWIKAKDLFFEETFDADTRIS